MSIVSSTADLRSTLASYKGHKRIALVPTMGCLHEGHLALIHRAKVLADVVVVSIYVNPLQFGPNEDFDAYPRSFEPDCELCEQAGVDFVFHPRSLYPNGKPVVRMQVGEIAEYLCGASRPGHFDGVATVVAILLNTVQPDIAVFGEKDWQQLAIIRRMVADLQLPVEIVGHATVREDDGLAMSSRNRYLSAVEREKAAAISRALQAVQQAVAEGQRSVDSLLAVGCRVLADAGLVPDYLEIRDAQSLDLLDVLGGSAARVFIACPVGPARLIDNKPLEINAPVTMETP